MWARIWAILLAGAGTMITASGEVLHLNEQAAITGKILAEKPDHYVVDVGYTVLLVPRNQVTRIEREPALNPLEVKSHPPDPKRDDLFFTAATPPSERPVREWAVEVGEAVVQVRTPSGLGSGFIISPEGHLITNTHVIENESQISVEVYHQRDGRLDRRNYRQVRLVALHKYADLALMKIEDTPAPIFRHVNLGHSDDLAVGERVFAIGSPLGLERTVTEGILSTKTREIQGLLYLQTTAQINPGNSGGPLFNLRGEVVGVTNMKITAGEGIGFAIPVDSVVYFLKHRDAFAYDNANPNTPFRYLEPPKRTRLARARDLTDSPW